MSTLKIKNLTKRFDDVVAVDDLSLEVPEGEFLTLLGPSGCGKTTTLRAIAGFHHPDAGEIWFGDRLMNNVPPNKRNTAMCFQSYALFPHMNVWDNISFGLKMRKMPAEQQKTRIHEALGMVGLEGLERRKPGQLSGGQQQRVALARAIVTQPDVLLFDEPLSNLDAKLRVQVRVEIREMQKRLGITSIYVTHDQDEALAISDRIVIMNRGRIEQLGDPHAIYLHPQTSFVAGFIGLANIFNGRAVSRDGERCTVETPVGTLCLLDRDRRLEPGSTASVSWRPEDMRPYRPGAANRVQATVLYSIFMGSISDLFIDVNGKRLRAQTDNTTHFKDGDSIELSIDEAAIRILEPDR
jgi:ABC-type Fe3+/spermidine/putrescine transport system ATPase subunit